MWGTWFTTYYLVLFITKIAEIRVAETQQWALDHAPHPSRGYRHFVDDGIATFENEENANSYLEYLNTLNPDLQYTIEHPTADGYLIFMDLLIHPNKSTSVGRKPTPRTRTSTSRIAPVHPTTQS